ncbi:aminopeptidase [Microbulbifer sp. OS29]|uniref:Aminopeptidase n=1 Tax=Microbulbifer okhotskensis TaxID=2926617 RepID=A0A9X2EJM8_9GAMM|nr:aminopeptidase [Microbulbifer okhotskensis]MCO1332906.1 aminopeptidase [Microbulbifer okhotskensis]
MYISIYDLRFSVRPRVWLVALIVTLLYGCETAGYYFQAATGQWRILSARQPIDEVVQDANTSEKLQRQLQLVQEIRAYAAQELRLPVGQAYSAYVQLEDEYPVWNVLAAPEFSLTPKRWCYPVAGCASYRGYFRKSAASAKASSLRHQGYDVYLGAVPAYSTLGWFNDPVLSSFVNWPPERLAGLLFHELAHRRVYVAGDTRFNESFATAVSEIALPDWLRSQGLSSSAEETQGQALAVRHLMNAARKELQPIYQSSLPDEEKREEKEKILSRLRRCYWRMAADWTYPARYQVYIEKTNNATLALAAEYESLVPAFQQLYLNSDGWEDFYNATERLGALEKSEREPRLLELSVEYRQTHVDTGRRNDFDTQACMHNGQENL